MLRYIENIQLTLYCREREDTVKNATAEKAAQIERLGMGVSKVTREGISHSAMGGVEVIEQVSQFESKRQIHLLIESTIHRKRYMRKLAPDFYIL